MQQSSKGFTLMELLIVMAIIAIGSAVLIPRIGNNEAKLYRVQLRTLSATLNYNRRNAVVLNRPFEMTLYPDKELASQESSEDEATENLKPMTVLSTKKKGDWMSLGADIRWQTDVKLIRNNVFKIRFFPQGGATGGIIRLQHGRFIAHLSIDGITGKVTIKESTDETDS